MFFFFPLRDISQSILYYCINCTVFHYPHRLSASVLQGFTCSSVSKMSTKKIKRLIHASRPRKGRAKVQLRESQVSSNEIYLTLNFILHLNGPLSKADIYCVFLDHFLQLTCMYNLLSGNLSQNFTDYPSDMLLYFKWVSSECPFLYRPNNMPLSYKSIYSLYDFPILMPLTTVIKISRGATAHPTFLRLVLQTSLWPPAFWTRTQCCSVKPGPAWWVFWTGFATKTDNNLFYNG